MEKIYFYKIKIVDFLENVLNQRFGLYITKKLHTEGNQQYYLIENVDTSEQRVLAVLPDSNVFSLYAYRKSGDSRKPFLKSHGIEVENGRNGSAGVLALLKYVFFKGIFVREKVIAFFKNKMIKVYEKQGAPEPAIKGFYLAKKFDLDDSEAFSDSEANKYLEQTRAMQISDSIACQYLQVMRAEPKLSYGQFTTPSYLGFKNDSGGYELCSLRIGESRTVSVANRKIQWFHVRDFTYISRKSGVGEDEKLCIFWDFWDFLSAEQIYLRDFGSLLTDQFSCLILNRHFDLVRFENFLDKKKVTYIKEILPKGQESVMRSLYEFCQKKRIFFKASDFRGQGFCSLSDKLLRDSEHRPCTDYGKMSLFKLSLQYENAMGQRLFIYYLSYDSVAERKYYDEQTFLKNWQACTTGLEDLKRKHAEHKKRLHYLDKETGEVKEDFVLKVAYLNANRIFETNPYGQTVPVNLDSWR